MPKIKDLYRCIFQFRHATYIERTQAYSADQARVIIANRIARRQGVEPWVVLKYVKDNPDAVSIGLEMVFEEVGDEQAGD